jgi:hypothetical protein
MVLNQNLSSININNSSVNETFDDTKLNQSNFNNNSNQLMDIRKIRVFQIDKPAEKKYRRVDEKKDRVLF